MPDDRRGTVDRHPILRWVTKADTWWALNTLVGGGGIKPAEVGAAFDALVEWHRERDDTASAATHEVLRSTVLRGLEIGVVPACREVSVRELERLPGGLGGPLGEVDAHIVDHLETADAAALVAAEQAWIELAETGFIHRLELPLRVSLLHDASVLHRQAFSVTSDPESLRYLVGTAQAAVTLMRRFRNHPPHCRWNLDPRLQTIVSLLANARGVEFALDRDPQAITEAIHLHELLLSLTGSDAPDYPRRLGDYAKARASQGRPGVEAGEPMLAEAVSLLPAGDVDRVDYLGDLGRARLARYDESKDRALLAEAQQLFGMAVQESCDRDGPARRGLRQTLLRRAVASRVDDDLETAIAMLKEDGEPGPALGMTSLPVRLLEAIMPILPDRRAGELVSDALDAAEAFTDDRSAAAVADKAELLAMMLDRHSPTDRRLIVDRKIDLLELSLRCDPRSGHTPGRHHNLAVHLAHRYEATAERRDLGRGIQSAALAVESGGEDDDGALYRSTFASLLMKRYEAVGAVTDLHHAVHTFNGLTGDERLRSHLGPLEWANLLNNHSAVLSARAERHRDPLDAERAIGLAEEAMAAATEAGDAGAVVRSQSNLATAHYGRWRLSGRTDDLDDAIVGWRKLASEAGQIGAGPPVATVTLNLGNALLARFELGRRPADLDGAIGQLTVVATSPAADAVNSALAANRLAAAHQLRNRTEDGHDDVAATTAWSSRAVDQAIGSSSETLFRVACDWGDRATVRASWEEASAAYRLAVGAIEKLLETNLLWRDQASWLRDAYGLATRAAYAMVRAGDPRSAVVALEAGRGLLLAASMGVVEARLELAAGATETSLLREYRDALMSWRTMASRVTGRDNRSEPDGPLWREVEASMSALFESRAALRTVPALATALQPPTYDQIHAVISDRLAYFVVGREGGVAILVDPEVAEPTVVHLDRFSEREVGEQTRAFFDAHRHLKDDQAAWGQALERVTAWLGPSILAVVAPTWERIVFVPTGALAFLPLHAAYLEEEGTPGRRYALDEAVITYAPTALSVAAAGNRVSVGQAARSLLAVASPRPSVEEPLELAGAEAQSISRLFAESRLLEGAAASRSDVTSTMPDFDVLHIACHALSVPTDPRSSGIVLANDRMLTVADLLGSDLSRAKLAVLSACETGVPGTDAPDETIGLTTAIFGAGVDGVISSFWQVVDWWAFLLMVRFYELWRNPDGPSDRDPSEALTLAQRWMRDSTNGEKRRQLTSWGARGRIPAEAVRTLDALLAPLAPGGLGFSGLDAWAPFFFTGISRREPASAVQHEPSPSGQEWTS